MRKLMGLILIAMIGNIYAADDSLKKFVDVQIEGMFSGWQPNYTTTEIVNRITELKDNNDAMKFIEELNNDQMFSDEFSDIAERLYGSCVRVMQNKINEIEDIKLAIKIKEKLNKSNTTNCFSTADKDPDELPGLIDQLNLRLEAEELGKKFLKMVEEENREEEEEES